MNAESAYHNVRNTMDCASIPAYLTDNKQIEAKFVQGLAIAFRVNIDVDMAMNVYCTLPLRSFWLWDMRDVQDSVKTAKNLLCQR